MTITNSGQMETQNKFSQLETVLQRIAAESSDAVRTREESAFARFAGPNEERLILFGAGSLGQLVFQGLERAGIRPIAFADNNKRLWHAEIAGIPVLPPSIASDRYRHSACFVVTIYNGSRARLQLKELGCKHVAPFAALYWKYAEIFTPKLGIDLPHKIRGFTREIRACQGVLGDQDSLRELAEQVHWRYWLDYNSLPPHLDPLDTYFPLHLIAPCDNEVFVDCGSFRGDTIPSFTSHWRDRFQHIFALEPDPQNRVVLEARTDELGLTDRVTVIPYAVADETCSVSFASAGTVTSQIVRDGGPAIVAECRRLDDIPWTLTPTYIKMDIEGAEPQAIVGASELLRHHHPILAVCIYHRSEHLWQIPNLIHSIAPEYSLFLHRYAEECWEGVCYAIPSHRLKRPR
jgi:FkbM family methyltransferase